MMMSGNKDAWDGDIPVDPVEQGYSFAFLRNSTFTDNTAVSDNGGVVNLGENASLWVHGDGNLFEGNQAKLDGAVVSATTDTTIEVDGGEFVNNESDSVRMEVMSRGRRSANSLVAVACSSFGSSVLGTGDRLYYRMFE